MILKTSQVLCLEIISRKEEEEEKTTNFFFSSAFAFPLTHCKNPFQLLK